MSGYNGVSKIEIFGVVFVFLMFFLGVFCYLMDNKDSIVSNYDSVSSYLTNGIKVDLESTTSGYKATVSNFEWSYNMVGVNQFGGDFESLNKLLYHKLKGKTGVCAVYFTDKKTNKYGNKTYENYFVGNICINELNKYVNDNYYNESGGVKNLLEQNIVNRQN